MKQRQPSQDKPSQGGMENRALVTIEYWWRAQDVERRQLVHNQTTRDAS